MGPSPTHHLPEGEGCEISVQHGSILWAEPAAACCSQLLRPPPTFGSCFVGAHFLNTKQHLRPGQGGGTCSRAFSG